MTKKYEKPISRNFDSKSTVAQGQCRPGSVANVRGVCAGGIGVNPGNDLSCRNGGTAVGCTTGNAP